MENLNNEKEKVGRKYLKDIQKNQFLKVKNSFLELEKHFIELKDRELKDRKVKIKREIEELFFKPILMSLDDLEKFEQNELKKIKPAKNS